ncbi:MAG: hypothetical protein EXS36_05795 [Pedosphaera sp.]|nr:hypothetical protein [Pedosphaera sp.]
MTRCSTSNTELAVDAIPSIGLMNFSAPNDTMEMGKTPSRAGHWQNNGPAGGNILFADGHVSWRGLREIRDCYRTTSGMYLSGSSLTGFPKKRWPGLLLFPIVGTFCSLRAVHP